MSTATGVNRKKSTSTGTAKKAGVSSPVRKSSSQGGFVDHISQARIKDLEQQVSELKRRLDELRKAKNTTIVKKDKEYVTTGAPQSPHNNSTTANCASEQRAPSMDTANEVKLQQSKQEIKTLQDNIAAMKELHRAEIEELKNETEKQASQSKPSFASDLENLKKQNRELKEENELLNAKTVNLQLRIDDLLEELSKKEAEWCSKEEKLILEATSIKLQKRARSMSNHLERTSLVKTSWGEKYQKWMAQTEQKIEELQTANNFLKMLLEKQKPDKS